MKRAAITLVAVVLAIFTSCQHDVVTSAGDGATRLTLSLSTTRTALGEKEEGGQYPLYWSEGDCIAVNGVLSYPVERDAADSSKGVFTLTESAQYPYHITYPYHSSATTTPCVLFPAEQSYAEATFSQGAVPMCGYVERAAATTTLRHLATLLRFAVKAGKEGESLSEIVITSIDGKPLAGEFAVDCATATLLPTDDVVSTLRYGASVPLSLSEERVFYISLPSLNLGVCRVEFVAEDGSRMVTSWRGDNLIAGVVKEFAPITYKAGATITLTPWHSQQDEIYLGQACGYVKDTAGNPIEGVAVSDGYSVVATNAEGYYALNLSDDAWYIYISVPSAYAIDTNEYGQPCFYQRIDSASPYYDFILTPLEGGVEERFALFAFADPQVASDSDLLRFQTESVPSIRSHADEVKADGLPCYGITLGDIIANSNTLNTDHLRDDMRDGFSISSLGMPVFQVMGNHDCTHFGPSNPIYADETSSSFEIKAQRAHEQMFGPVNYSFNRGKVHIVAMRDIVYTSNSTVKEMKTGFFASQWRWLQQDLALVPKENMVVLCVHAPLLNLQTRYVQEVLSLIDGFERAYILSGHTHFHRKYEHTVEGTPYNIYEHNLATLCGVWWEANIAADGSPNGYGVFVSEGNDFVDWYYMGCNDGMNTRSHQMRLYRGDAVSGGAYGYYGFNFGESTLVANIYNADSEWEIKVYEDGVYKGNMTKVVGELPSFSSLIGSGTKSDPYREDDGVALVNDIYATGYIQGVQRYSAWSPCYHLYSFELSNKDAEVRVEATDSFGNIYTETKITEGTDYTCIK